MKLIKDEIRPIAFAKLSFPAICVSSLVFHAIMGAADNPSMKMKKTVEIFGASLFCVETGVKAG